MHLWDVTIQLRSGLGTPLSNHTIWGHVCWGIRYHEGEKALLNFLKKCDEGNPPIVISDAMPIESEGRITFLPKPVLPAKPRPLDDPGNESADSFKKQKKQQWISESDWDSIASTLSISALNSVLSNQLAPALKKATVLHASINRMTGTTTDEDGTGALFDQEQLYPDTNQGKFRLIVCGADSDRVEQLMNWAFEGGYGRDASSGLGNISVTSISPFECASVSGANCVMLLGSAVPSSSDPRQGFFSWGVHAGRVGGTFANSELPNGSTQRAKRPVHLLQRGTILKTSEPLQWVGRSVAGVHDYEPIRHGGFTPCIPCKVDEETLQMMEGGNNDC